MTTNSPEYYKIAGAVLPALLLIVGLKVIIDTHLEGRHGSTPGFTLPAPAPEAVPGAEAGKGGAAPAAFDPAAVVAGIAAGKPENGEAIFKQCAACHVNDKAAKSTVGPNLWGVVGRARASHADYEAKYSKAMKDKGGEWTYAELAGFIHDPTSYIPGTAMKFKGIKDPTELADLIAFLRTTADSPAPLP